MIKRVGLIAATAFVALASGRAFAQDYAIKVDRPEKAGFERREAITVDETRTFDWFQQEKSIKSTTSAVKVKVELDAKTLAVDEGGKPTHMTCTIRKWEGAINGKPVTEVEEGMVIDVKLENGKAIITNQGSPFSPKVETLLHTFLPSDADAKVTTGMDEEFGSSERKKVGDIWPINAAAAAKSWKEIGTPADEKSISGSVTLRKLQDIRGIPCMQLDYTLNVGKFEVVELHGMAAKALNSHYESVTTMDLPIDTTLPEMGGSMTSTAKLDAEISTPQGPLQLKMSANTKIKGTITPIGPSR